MTIKTETKWSISPSERASSRPPQGLLVANEAPSTDAEPKRATTMPAMRKAAPLSSAAPRKRRASIREDHVGDAVRLNSDAHDLLRKSVPRLLRSRKDCAAAPLDHREGFLLAHIDGKTSVEALVDISGMSEGDVLPLLQRLRRLGVISLG